MRNLIAEAIRDDHEALFVIIPLNILVECAGRFDATEAPFTLTRKSITELLPNDIQKFILVRHLYAVSQKFKFIQRVFNSAEAHAEVAVVIIHLPIDLCILLHILCCQKLCGYRSLQQTEESNTGRKQLIFRLILRIPDRVHALGDNAVKGIIVQAAVLQTLGNGLDHMNVDTLEHIRLADACDVSRNQEPFDRHFGSNLRLQFRIALVSLDLVNKEFRVHPTGPFNNELLIVGRQLTEVRFLLQERRE